MDWVDWTELALGAALLGLAAFGAWQCRTAARRAGALAGVCAVVAAPHVLDGWINPAAVLLAALAVTVIALPALLFGRLLSSLLSGLRRQ